MVSRSAILDRCIASLLTSICLSMTAGCHMAATGHNVDGRRMYEQGQFSAALQHFQEAIRSDPNNADGYYNMAATFHRTGKQSDNQEHLKQAETLYLQCLEKDPNHVEGHRGLAVLYAETNRTTDAFGHLESWVRGDRQNPDAWTELARLNLEFGRENTAKQQLDQAIRLDPTNPRVLNSLGYLREQRGEIEQAMQNYARSYQANDFQPAIAARIAQLQHSLNARATSGGGNNGTRTVDSGVHVTPR